MNIKKAIALRLCLVSWSLGFVSAVLLKSCLVLSATYPLPSFSKILSKINKSKVDLRKKIYDITLILLLKGKLVNNTASSSTGENNNEMVVTPWEVKGKVDYERLIREFGTQPLTTELIKKVEKHTGNLHLQLERKIFFSHRDLDTVLDLYDKGVKFVLYTGRGPSGPVHIGHLVPWIFTLHIQQKFGTCLYF